MEKFKISASRLSSWLIIGVLGIFAVGVVAFAYTGGNPSALFEGDCVNCTIGEQKDGQSLGGVTSENEIFSADVAVEGLLATEGGIGQGSVDDNLTLTDGRIAKMVSVDLSATSSAGILNPEGETIWVYDSTVLVQTATSTAIAYLTGTTTAGIVPQDGTCGATGDCAAATAGMASILNTGTAAATTVGNTFFKLDYQGTDTRDASGVRYLVPVLSTEYLTCTASTTPATNGVTGGQAAQCQFHYFVIED